MTVGMSLNLLDRLSIVMEEIAKKINEARIRVERNKYADCGNVCNQDSGLVT